MKCLLCERNEVKFDFARRFPISVLCAVMQVTRSAYYPWSGRPGKLITTEICSNATVVIAWVVVISTAFIKAYSLSKPPTGLVFHSDCAAAATERV